MWRSITKQEQLELIRRKLDEPRPPTPVKHHKPEPCPCGTCKSCRHRLATRCYRNRLQERLLDARRLRDIQEVMEEEIRRRGVATLRSIYG